MEPVNVVRPSAGAAQAHPDARQGDTPTAGFRQLLREIALLLTYEVTRDLKLDDQARSRRRCADGCADPRGQEAGLRLDPARRQRPARGHARPRALGPRRPYRHLPRSRDAGAASSITSRRRATSPTAWSSSSIRCWRPPIRPIAGDHQAEGARRQGHPLRLPARRAGRHRALPPSRIPTCRSSPPRSTSI